MKDNGAICGGVISESQKVVQYKATDYLEIAEKYKSKLSPSKKGEGE